MDRELTSLLNNFYVKRAGPAMQSHETLFQLRSFAGRLFERVKKKDRRFSGDMVDVGSLYSEVQAMHVEECDMLIILDIPGQWEEDRRYPNFARFRLADEEWKDCANREDYLLPRKIADLFFQYVSEIVRTENMGRTRPQVKGRGTVATTLSVDKSGMEDLEYLSRISMDIDLVIAIRCHGWPRHASAGWLSDSTSGWPGRDKVREIKRQGFQLVPKSRDNDKTLWRLSFATAEASLLERIDSIGGAVQLCHKKLLIILKCIMKLEFSAGPDTTPIISSYMLKTLLYHQRCRYPDPRDWSEDKLGERFQRTVDTLYDCVKRESLPHFFVPSENLFEHRGVRALEKKMKEMKDHAFDFVRNLEKSTYRHPFSHGFYKSK